MMLSLMLWACGAAFAEKVELPAKVAALRGPLLIPAPLPGPAYRRTFSRLVSSRPAIDRYDALIVRWSQKRRLNPRLVKAIIAAESEFQPRALSPAGARGLMQLMPATAAGLGVEADSLWQPEHNIRAGTGYLEYLFGVAWKRYKLEGRYADAPSWVVRRVIACYHAGPKFMRGPPYFESTRHYVRKVSLYHHSTVADLNAEAAMADAR